MDKWWEAAPLVEQVGETDSPPPAAAEPAPPRAEAIPTGGAPEAVSAEDKWWESAPLVAPPSVAPERGFGAGLSRNTNITGQFIGSNLESLGRATGVETLEEFGRKSSVRNKAALAAKGPGMTSSDIDGVGSLGTFIGEKVGESFTPMVTGIGAAGAAILAAPVAIPTALVGIGAATAANLPYYFGSMREGQKDADIEAGRPIEVDEGAAALYGLGASALDGLTEVFFLSKLAAPLKAALEGTGKSLFTRVATNAATGSATESLTELGQTVLERHQAGRSLTDDDAMAEYKEAMIAGGILGGIGGGAVGVAPSTGAKPVQISESGPDEAESAALAGVSIPTGGQATQTAASVAQDKVAPDEAAAMVPREAVHKTLNDIRAAREAREAAAAQSITPVAPTVAPPVAAPPVAAAPIPMSPMAPVAAPPNTPLADPVVTPPGNQLPPVVEPVVAPPPVAAAPAPVPPVAPQEVTSGDEIPTVPETPEQIEAQMASLVDPKDERAVVFAPFGGIVPAIPKGTIARVEVEDGYLFFNYQKSIGGKKLNKNRVKFLNEEGRRNELLGLGPYNKAEVAERGVPDLGVVERDPNGVPVKEVAATAETAPEQAAAIEALAPEGNTVTVVPAEQVIEERQANKTVGDNQLDAPAEGEMFAPSSKPRQAPQEATPQEAAPLPDNVTVDPATGRKTVFIKQTPEERDFIGAERSRIFLERREREMAVANKNETAEERDARAAGILAKANRGELPAEEEMNARISDKELKKNPGRARLTLKRFRAAAMLLDDMPPGYSQKPENISTDEGVVTAFGRIEATIVEADKRKIAIPREVSNDISNALAWLVMVKAMNKVRIAYLSGSESVRAKILERLGVFLSGERIFWAEGDSTALRAEKKAESDSITEAHRGTPAEAASASAADDETSTSAVPPDEFEVSPDEFELPSDYTPMEFGYESVTDEESTTDEDPVAEDDDFDAPAEEALYGPDGKPGVERPPVNIKGEAFTAVVAKTPPKVETRKKRVLTRPGNTVPNAKSKGGGATSSDLDTDGSEMSLAENIVSLSDLQEELLGRKAMENFFDGIRGFTDKQQQLQRLISRRMYRMLLDVVGDVKVVVMQDDIFDLYRPQADAYYNARGDYIAVRSSIMADPAAAVHTILHEAAHAAFIHTIHMSEKDAKTPQGKRLALQIDTLMGTAKEYAAAVGYDTEHNGFLDIHEFVSEMWANPEFQEFLASVPISKNVQTILDIKPAQAHLIRYALDWIKFKVADMLGIRQMLAAHPAGTTSALEVSLDLGGRILQISPSGREAFYNYFPDYAAVSPAYLPRSKKGSNAAKLEARGLDPKVAREISDIIDADFGGKVTDEELDALATIAKVPNSGTISPWGFSPVPPPVTPVTSWGNGSMPPRVVRAFNPKPGRVWMGGKTGKFLLSVMTLDGISRRARPHFKDADGNAMMDYENAQLKHDTTRRRIEEPHYEDFAAFEELKRVAPKAAERLAQLIMNLAPIDVELGPNAKNLHLQGNARKNLQAKARLPALQAEYNALLKSNPEAIALLHTMGDHYRESFNQHVRVSTYNILNGLETKVSNSDLMRIMDHAVEGKLTTQDEIDVGNATIFSFLKKSENLRTRKGMYFPSTRFGNHVVQTRMALKDPKITRVVTRGSKTVVPVSTEINGGVIRFTFDHSIRGARPAAARAFYDFAAAHELPMTSYVARFRDRATGEIVGKDMQAIGETYDMVHEIRFQNEGVHFFEDKKDADAFFAEAQKDEAAGKLEFVKGIMDKHEVGEGHLVGADRTSLDNVMKALKASGKLSEGQIALMGATIKQSIVMQMAGNRYEQRLLGRKNVAGASLAVGRAAAVYGRSVGNAIAAGMSGQASQRALDRMRAVASTQNDKTSNGEVNNLRSQVINELTKREDLVGSAVELNQVVNDLMTVNSIDKLASVANWFLNGSQVLMSTLPVLGARFGNAKTASAAVGVYRRIGIKGVIGGGLRNAAKGVTSWGKTQLDTENLLTSVRNNLGPEYKDLIDELVDHGDVAEGVGIENAEQFSAGRGAAGMALTKADRIIRAMPNAVEVVNRTVTAVLAYDLSRADGVGHQEAIQYAMDTVRQTQFRYDPVNSPRLMLENKAFKFFFTFKKFGFGQYQMLIDAVDKAYNGASLEERKIAGKQLANMFAVQALTAGVFSLPGVEIIKAAVMIGAVLGLVDGWDDEVERIRGLMKEAVGNDMAQIFSKGLVSRAVGVDLSNRLSWADLITGFPPGGDDAKSTWAWVGKTIAGAPGTMPYEMALGAKKFAEGVMEDSPKDMWTGVSMMVPVKTLADTAKAVEGLRSTEMTPGDAIKQVIGFKSLKKSDESDALGVEIRANTRKKGEEAKLISRYYGAKTPADVRRAAQAIEEYNKTLDKDAREISVDGLEKKRKEKLKEKKKAAGG